MIENQTAVELARHCNELTGWKKAPSGGEIDFILRLSDGLAIPVECKASLTINRRHMRGVLDYLSLLSLRTGVVVSLAPHAVTPFEDGRRVINIPAYLVERLPDLARD
ncbi:ATP-binding protein [PVC group bacterium]|nr:ATP-binding protein [PVC group bacterium]